MLFNTVSFPFFLLATLIAFFGSPPKWRSYILLLTSYLFYSFWNWKFCGLLLLSTVVDFYCGRHIGRAPTRDKGRRFLVLSIVTNLGILGFFKYFNFFADSFVDFSALLGWHVHPVTLNIILPVGISFYTFQTMSYTIEVWRGEIKPCDSLRDFALYVSFFPQLVAGPIERASHLLPQLQDLTKPINRRLIHQGALLILTGYVKKVILSDQISPYADQAFENWQSLGSFDLWEGLLIFTLQIYFDFSGYTDIARGISKWFGIDLMVNFRQPYLAENITDFWHRWHISLSTWLKEYLYIPLGGNRKGPARTYVNLMITMLLGGLWHGANLTFVFWGFLHGLYVAVHKRFGRTSTLPSAFRPLKILFTHFLVVLTWLPFRSPDFSSMWGILRKLFVFQGAVDLPAFGLLGVLYGALFLLDYPVDRTQDEFPILRLPAFFRMTYYTVTSLLIVFLLLSVKVARPFVYFQF
ncbi:MAG: MBOAT family protein [Bdellovibrionales bacterium]|nr:MBOAT family protein [Bdellovibrionales bacterium]